jgi:hypothetical protein
MEPKKKEKGGERRECTKRNTLRACSGGSWVEVRTPRLRLCDPRSSWMQLLLRRKMDECLQTFGDFRLRLFGFFSSIAPTIQAAAPFLSFFFRSGGQGFLFFLKLCSVLCL